MKLLRQPYTSNVYTFVYIVIQYFHSLLLILHYLLCVCTYSDDDMISLASMMSVSNLSMICNLEDEDDDLAIRRLWVKNTQNGLILYPLHFLCSSPFLCPSPLICSSHFHTHTLLIYAHFLYPLFTPCSFHNLCFISGNGRSISPEIVSLVALV